MKGNRPDIDRNIAGENVVPFRTRSKQGSEPAGDRRHGDILRLLDLKKFERTRHPTEHDASMRANIAAMVLLGLLVFVAAEDFSRLEWQNQCSYKVDCRNW
jgi:hypothetical protein